MNFLKKLFDKEHKHLKKYMTKADEVIKIKDKFSDLTDEQIKKEFLKARKIENEDKKIIEMMAILSVISERVLGLIPYKVQIIGMQALLDGKIAEMKTGEGKTLVAGLASIIGAEIYGKSFVVTVNEYLAKRDNDFINPLVKYLDLKCGCLIESQDESDKKEIYSGNIVYGTNSSFAFDYLKENLIYSMQDSFVGEYGFVIVDEVDSILIDEARTPLIISGSADFNNDFYIKSFEVAKKLLKEEDYKKDLESKSIVFTESGISKIEDLLKIDKLYVHKNINWAHQVLQSLQAMNFYNLEVEYMLKDGEVKIIDEYTGRVSDGRRWSGGLHQALEVKEKMEIKEENKTLAEITYQSYFKLFKKLSGMSGTVKTEEKEFFEIYNCEVVSIPPNKPIQRIDNEDLMFANEDSKVQYILNKAKELSKDKKPLLIGTVSVEQSEKISKIFKENKIKHSLLNAKNHENEAEIIKNAGQLGTITIATNMAGRGVDISLTQDVIDNGGLNIIGFERYQNRRIDNQLIGRSGRQGNPGETRFLLSLDDTLLAMTENPMYKTMKQALEEDKEGTEFSLLTKIIKKQQKKIEGLHYDYRKNLYKFDKILAENRNSIYEMRKDTLVYEENEETCEIFQEKLKNYINELMPLYFNLSHENGEFNKELLETKILSEYGFSMKENNIESIDSLKDFLIKECFEKITLNNIDTIKRIFVEQIDKNWKSYLTNIGILREGIHLRGYNHKDPVIEFQIESQILFSKVVPKIKKNIIEVIVSFEFNLNSFNDIEKIVGKEETELINLLEKYNKEVEDFSKEIISGNLNYEVMVENYIKNLIEDIFSKDFYKNKGVNFKEAGLLYDLGITDEDSDKLFKESKTYKKYKNNLLIKVVKIIKFELENIKEDKELIYRDVFISSLEENHNNYMLSLKDILNEETKIDDVFEEINNNYQMFHLNMRLDIVRTMTRLQEVIGD